MSKQRALGMMIGSLLQQDKLPTLDQMKNKTHLQVDH